MPIPALLLTISALILGHFVLAAVRGPTRSIPGPFITRFTRLWYLLETYRGRFERTNAALHQKFGPIFRYGPNEFSVSDPSAIKQIYGHGKEFDKAPWYKAFSMPNVSTIFTEQNIKVHAQTRRKFQHTYSMTSIVHYEAFTDKAIELFCERLDDMSNTPEQLIDMGWWFLCFAGDAIALITFSKRYGFLDKGEDQQGLLKAMHDNLAYAALVGVYHELHSFISGVLQALIRFGWISNAGRTLLIGFTQKIVDRRLVDRSQGKNIKPVISDDYDGPKDFTDKFLDSHLSDPTDFTRMHIQMGLVANVVAGADTTAASLSAVLYHLLKSPKTLTRLREEIDGKWSEGELSSPVTFKEAQSMHYLQAVIQEGLRVHPAVGLPLVRSVPQGGVNICGYDLPKGAWVGINAWVLHYNTEIYGEDATLFRPERWLEADKEKLSGMQRYWIPFGLGGRTCIGKNISMLEMCKVLPEILRRFEFELSPELQKNAWDTTNHWFVIPNNFRVTVKRRSV